MTDDKINALVERLDSWVNKGPPVITGTIYSDAATALRSLLARATKAERDLRLSVMTDTEYCKEVEAAHLAEKSRADDLQRRLDEADGLWARQLMKYGLGEEEANSLVREVQNLRAFLSKEPSP